jgi:hypothetical protein
MLQYSGSSHARCSEKESNINGDCRGLLVSVLSTGRLDAQVKLH